MGAKQVFTAGLALCFAAVGVSANYMPDITHIFEQQSGVVFDGANDEYAPEAVVNRVAELDRVALPAYEGRSGVCIYAQDNGFVLKDGDEQLDSYTFTDDTGELITASADGGNLVFANSSGVPITDFYINYEHIIYDTNGDIHTPSGILRRITEMPKEQTIEELTELIGKDTESFKSYVSVISGEDSADGLTAEDLVADINSYYLEIDKYAGFVSSYGDEEIKEKLTAVTAQIEEMTAVVNTASASGGDVAEQLNMNKLIILTSVLNNTLEQKGVVTAAAGGDDDEPAVTDKSSGGEGGKATSKTTKKKTTTTTTKKTTKKKTTTTADEQPQQTQAQTQQQTQAPATTTARRPVVTVTTTTAPRFTVKEYSKTIYAIKAGSFYEQPDLTSTVRGSFEKYYNAACTGETSNGYYRILINGYTLYAPKSDYSEDPNSTIITTTAPKIKTGNINKYTKEMLTYINALRKEHGIDPLEGYEVLDNAADIRAKELKTLFDHTRPDGTGYKTVYDKVKLKWSRIAENITYGMNKTYTVADAFDNWKNSQGHLNNMLNPDYKYMAIGYYSYTDKDGNDYNYWEQLFYTP